MSKYLGRAGYKCEGTNNGEEGIEKFGWRLSLPKEQSWSWSVKNSMWRTKGEKDRQDKQDKAKEGDW